MFKLNHPSKLLLDLPPSLTELEENIDLLFRFSRREIRWLCRRLGEG